ncbi:MAG: polysaccharide biosynthesis/export family protein [Ginsengibacter sp.]
MKPLPSTLLLIFLVFQILLFSSSCTSSKRIVYFDNVADTSFVSRFVTKDLTIQNNDILNITVSSLSPEASAIFNTNTVSNLPNAQSMGGYLVNSDGNIQLPILGTIKATGLTKGQLKDFITNSLLEKKLLIDPIVNVRQVNFRVTVLGEVLHPTVIPVPSEKISLLEALGLAGDLTIFGKRENVLLIREENGRKQVRRINLASRNFFLSPYYYLQPNDVLYVEPDKAKISTASLSRQWIPTIISSVSIITLLIYRLNR